MTGRAENPRSTSLEELAASFCKGDAASFEKLVKAHSRPLLALAYRYTRDWDSAQDLCQETWIKIHDQIGRYDPRRPFGAWLHTIHRNNCLSFLRKVAVRKKWAASGQALHVVDGSDPLATTEHRDFMARLGRALNRLSEKQRRIFALVDIEQTDQEEAARMLGIKYNTLRSTLHFARRRLAGLLEEAES